MKLSFSKNLVSLAVASVVAGGAMVAAPASAMNISQNNVGQVMLFPYYRAAAGIDTVMSVVNTSGKTAVFKIRFREGVNSEEVRDFNVILSPYDVWNGAVTKVGSSTVFRTFDKSCTSPQLPGMTVSTLATDAANTAARAVDGAKGEVSFASVGDNSEGHFEIILMGVSDGASGSSALAVETGALHANNVPVNCSQVDRQFLNANISTLDAEMAPPENILKASARVISSVSGMDFNADPTAIESFQTTEAIVDEPGSLNPDLADGDIGATVNVLDNGVGRSATFGASEDAVSAMLSASSIANEFASGTGAATSWVVTLPTKHHYATSSTCYAYQMDMYNREEKTEIDVGSTQFSPAPNPGQDPVICAETTVFNFNGADLFGTGPSASRVGINTDSVGTSGWVNTRFQDSIDNGSTLTGLPVIGFAALVRSSGDATTNYGTTQDFTVTRGNGN